MKLLATLALCVSALCTTSASAGILPLSYDMPNGGTGSYTYWDDSYDGTGCTTCTLASLSGGKGDLTDGVIANQNWYITPGAYVGWTIDPTITFHFAPGTAIDAVTFHFDDSNGSGGVTPPSGVVVNGQQYSIADPAAGTPFAYTVSSLGFMGTDLTVTLNNRSGWLFLSEVTFEGQAADVPEPGSLMLVLPALAGLVAARRRRAAR